MAKMKSLRGGNDIMNNNMSYVIVFIILIIVIIIGVYMLFFRKSAIPTPIPSQTYESTPTPTSISTSSPNKIKKTIDKIKNSKIIKNIEADLKEWKNDIETLPIELKEAAINCYSNPQGCIF
jgi:hypothetical protein